MSQNIHLLSISHSFLKKINTDVYSLLSKKFNLNVTLVSPTFHFEGKKKIKPDFKENEIDIKIITKKTFFNHLRFKIYRNLISEIKKNKITHLLLDFDIMSLQSIILIVYSFLYDYKIFYYSNENNIIKEKHIIKKIIKIFFYRLFSLLIAKKLINIFCYTKQIKENLDYCGFKEKTKIVPLGFNNKIFYRLPSNFNENIFIISYFGRISKKKGLHTLVKALNKLNLDKWIFYLDIFEIDNISYYKSIKQDLKNLNKNKKLKIIKASHNDIHNYMKKTKLTIVPSEWNEQYGRIIQEAAACGSIVVGSNVGSIPEILIDKEFIFKDGNVNELKEKIEDIYYNYKFYRKKFDLIENNIISNRTTFNQAKIIFDSIYK